MDELAKALTAIDQSVIRHSVAPSRPLVPHVHSVVQPPKCQVDELAKLTAEIERDRRLCRWVARMAENGGDEDEPGCDTAREADSTSTSSPRPGAAAAAAPHAAAALAASRASIDVAHVPPPLEVPSAEDGIALTSSEETTPQLMQSNAVPERPRPLPMKRMGAKRSLW